MSSFYFTSNLKNCAGCNRMFERREFKNRRSKLCRRCLAIKQIKDAKKIQEEKKRLINKIDADRLRSFARKQRFENSRRAASGEKE